MLLRDHGNLTPGTIPLRSLGVTAHGRLTPLQRSACDYAEVSLSLCICHCLPQGATLILTHPLYRSLHEEVLARSESTWLGILTPIQVTYLPICIFSFQSPIEGNPVSFFEAEIFVPLFIRNKLGDFSIYFLQGKSKKGLGCNQLGTTEAKTLCIF